VAEGEEGKRRKKTRYRVQNRSKKKKRNALVSKRGAGRGARGAERAQGKVGRFRGMQAVKDSNKLEKNQGKRRKLGQARGKIPGLNRSAKKEVGDRRRE